MEQNMNNSEVRLAAGHGPLKIALVFMVAVLMHVAVLSAYFVLGAPKKTRPLAAMESKTAETKPAPNPNKAVDATATEKPDKADSRNGVSTTKDKAKDDVAKPVDPDLDGLDEPKQLK